MNDQEMKAKFAKMEAETADFQKLYGKVFQVEAISDLLMTLQHWRAPFKIGEGEYAAEISNTFSGCPWETELANDLAAVKEKHRAKLEQRLRDLFK